MGYSSWSSNSYADYTSTRASYSREQMFSSRRLKEYLDPRKVTIRESRDSEQHPNSTPVILALDVTGSMGMIAEHMARKGIGELIETIIDQQPIQDPHVMFMGVGDAICYDSAPLQVSQFETDLRIVEQLSDIWLEGGGGGNGFESYDLPWYFAANYTSIDSFEKRGKKGYLFTIGDDAPPPRGLDRSVLERVFDDGDGVPVTKHQLLEAAQKQWDVFHVIVEQGGACRNYARDNVIGGWRELLGSRAILLDDYKYLSQVISAVIRAAEGIDPETIIVESPTDARRTIRRALYGE